MTGRAQKSTSYVARARPVVPPIYQSATFFLDDLAYKDIQEGGGLTEHWYSRFANPTVDVAAAEIAELEGAEAALAAMPEGDARLADYQPYWAARAALLARAGAADAAREAYAIAIGLERDPAVRRFLQQRQAALPG